MSKSKKKYSNKAKDNLGLAYKYAVYFTKNLKISVPKNFVLEDSEIFADALEGLCAAEKKYDVERINPSTNKSYSFSTYAFACMRTHCIKGMKKRERQNRLFGKKCIYEEEEHGENSSYSDSHIYKAIAISRLLRKKLKLDKESYKIDMEMLIMHFINGKPYDKIGKKYGVSRERVRQRINRIKDYIFINIDYALLEEEAYQKSSLVRKKYVSSCDEEKFANSILV